MCSYSDIFQNIPVKNEVYEYLSEYDMRECTLVLSNLKNATIDIKIKIFGGIWNRLKYLYDLVIQL